MSYELAGLGARRRIRRRRVAPRLHSIAVRESARLSGLGFSFKRPKALRKLTIKRVVKRVVTPLARLTALQYQPLLALKKEYRKELVPAWKRGLMLLPFVGGSSALLSTARSLPVVGRAIQAAEPVVESGAGLLEQAKQLAPLMPGPAEQAPTPSSGGGGGSPDEAEPSDSTPAPGPAQGAALLGPGIAIVAGLALLGLAFGAKRR